MEVGVSLYVNILHRRVFVVKKIVFLFTFMICFLILGNTDTSVFAQELESDEGAIDISVEDLGELPYTVVSEEQVISDYMEWANVDRETAVKEMGLEESKSLTARASSSCWHEWREYKIPKKLIDSTAKAYLTTYPYIKMKQCGDDRAEITDVSPQVSYEREGGIAISNIVLKDITAEKESKYVCRVRANGVITNTFGFELRDWKYSQPFTFMGP
ncbi:hypothetical protein [Streptomyces sp. NPDC048275]|uniref:hypothetical protein n=1 Tax=Streptomyces sp. NPDC048275 TaxID=3155629 RepID=UPI0033FDFD97